MNSIEISNILQNNIVTKKYFSGVCASDQMLQKRKRPYCFVANTDREGQKGDHWTCWFITRDNTVYFFDSFGRNPYSRSFPISFRKFINNRKFRFNPRVLQPINGETCGEFCIFVIYYLCLDVDLKSIYNYFTNDLLCNDNIVSQFINQL